MSFARKLKREKAKKAFKELKKNKEYKFLKFPDFMKLYKAGFVTNPIKESGISEVTASEEQLDSILIDDEIEEVDYENSGSE